MYIDHFNNIVEGLFMRFAWKPIITQSVYACIRRGQGFHASNILSGPSATSSFAVAFLGSTGFVNSLWTPSASTGKLHCWSLACPRHCPTRSISMIACLATEKSTAHIPSLVRVTVEGGSYCYCGLNLCPPPTSPQDSK